MIKAITDLDFGPADNLVPLLEHELAGEHRFSRSAVGLCGSAGRGEAADLAAYRNLAQAAKLSKSKAAGPGRGKKRKSNVAGEEGAADGEDDEDGDVDVDVEGEGAEQDDLPVEVEEADQPPREQLVGEVG